jgi:hypothetical protein
MFDEVGKAAARECAAAAFEGKTDEVVVGYAFALAFASEVVVGILFDWVEVGTEGSSRG